MRYFIDFSEGKDTPAEALLGTLLLQLQGEWATLSTALRDRGHDVPKGRSEKRTRFFDRRMEEFGRPMNDPIYREARDLYIARKGTDREI